jgi:hypothetical protein
MSSQKYDFIDLILLIGTNPLPNYVVAKYFHNTNKTLERVWLIYSETTDFYQGTEQYAKDIKKVLEKEFKESDVRYLLYNLSDISRARTIEERVAKILSEQSGRRKVHLNYTGGTKAMSVHAYRALEKEFGEGFSASYLDARDYRIKFDKNPDIDTGDLRKAIQLEMPDLFSLHNSEILVGSTNNEYFEAISDLDGSIRDNIMQSIADLAKEEKLLDLREWLNTANQGELFSGEKSKGEIEETMAIFNDNHHENELLFNYLSKFPDNDRFCDEEGNWSYSNFGKNKNTKQLNKFLSGGWLEAYVAWVIGNNCKDQNSVITNIHLKTKGNKSVSKDFEIDVLAKNGYQICGISCGTSLKFTKDQQKETLPDGGKLKNKGFEVILRSSQIGGDEARSVLVTLLNPKLAKDLEDDLKAATGAGQDKFIVLGRKDLPAEKMWKKLKKHIFG